MGLEDLIFVEIERFLWKCDLCDRAAEDSGCSFYSTVARRGSRGCEQKLVSCPGGEKGPESRGSMSFFGVPSTSSGQALRLRLSQETAPNSAQDDEFNLGE